MGRRTYMRDNSFHGLLQVSHGVGCPTKERMFMGMQRLAHVDVTVTDLDLATAYYTEVIGMPKQSVTRSPST